MRYEWPCPGNLLYMGVKKFGSRARFASYLTGRRTIAATARGESSVDRCCQPVGQDDPPWYAVWIAAGSPRTPARIRPARHGRD